MTTRAAARSTFATFVIALAGMLTAVTAAADVPPWLRDALARIDPLPESSHGAVALELESHITVHESGRMSRREHGAIRVLNRDGARYARAVAIYRTDAGRVRAFRAWVVPPGGAVTELPPSQVLDAAYIGEELYSEVRFRHVSAGDVPAGSVFAWESAVEQDEPFPQFEHAFQSELPVRVSRLRLEVPDGWSVSPGWANHGAVAPRIDGAVRTWELTGLADLTDEPLRPSARGLVPRLEITVTPSAGHRSQAPAFSDWRGVTAWLANLSPNAGEADPAIASTARRVVLGARTELDTIRACAGYVQRLRYVSIQMGLATGGGYRPRPPGVVLSRAYGDCKDKANLLRALLGAMGRPSYLVAVHVPGAGYVREEWPSPIPFNHCILAVALRTSPKLASEVAHAGLGRLLIFDPTDPNTPVGDLSRQSQGGLALVVAPQTDRLIALPTLPPEADRVERRMELTLSEAGDVEGSLVERCIGQSAATERATRRGLDARGYHNAVLRWLQGAVNNARIENVEFHDDTLGGRYETRIRFQAPAVGQTMQQRLMLIRPPIVERLGVGLATDRPRRYPLELEARAVRETLVIHTPSGFDVDEIPEAMDAHVALAQFDARTEAREGAIVQTRTLVTTRGRVEVDAFEALRTFFARVRAAEDAPLVLARR